MYNPTYHGFEVIEIPSHPTPQTSEGSTYVMSEWSMGIDLIERFTYEFNAKTGEIRVDSIKELGNASS